MLIASVVLFLAAAVAGVTLAIRRAQTNENPPLPIALIHGPLAIAGFVVLLVYLFQNGFAPIPSLAAGLFGVAALGGLTLITTHLRGSTISFALIIGHAIFAVSGVVLLLVTIVMETM